MFSFLASSWIRSLVGRCASPCERSPPRYDADFLPRVEVLPAVCDSPDLARSLLTVRAANSFACPADTPRFCALHDCPNVAVSLVGIHDLAR